MRGGPAPSVCRGQGVCLPLKRRRPPRGAVSGCQFSRALVSDWFRTEVPSSLDVQSARAGALRKGQLLPLATARTLWMCHLS